MKIISLDALWKPGPKAAEAASADLQKAEASWMEKRAALFLEHEQLSTSKAAVFESGGAVAVKANLQRMRDIEDELEVCDISLKAVASALKDAYHREALEKIKIDSKQWEAEARLEADLRAKWLKSAVELYKLHDEYFKARRKCMAWRTVIGSPEAQALKPADALYEQLKKKGQHLNYSHPVNNEETFKGLKAARDFQSFLDELGVKAA